jgi:hypothetical protein
MPIPIQLEKNPFLREIVEHVRKDCTIDNIGLVLRSRFGVLLPTDLRDRLLELSQDELDDMLGRSAIAATAEDALAVRPKGLPRVDAGNRVGTKKASRGRVK